MIDGYDYRLENLLFLRELIKKEGIPIFQEEGDPYRSYALLGKESTITLVGMEQGNTEDSLAILAHEFGHCLAYRIDRGDSPQLSRAQDRYHRAKRYLDWHDVLRRFAKLRFLARFFAYRSRSLAEKFLPLIIPEEERAWDLGFQYLRDHGIPISSAMEEVRSSCLDCYRKAFL